MVEMTCGGCPECSTAFRQFEFNAEDLEAHYTCPACRHRMQDVPATVHLKIEEEFGVSFRQ